MSLSSINISFFRSILVSSTSGIYSQYHTTLVNTILIKLSFQELEAVDCKFNLWRPYPEMIIDFINTRTRHEQLMVSAIEIFTKIMQNTFEHKFRKRYLLFYMTKSALPEFLKSSTKLHEYSWKIPRTSSPYLHSTSFVCVSVSRK